MVPRSAWSPATESFKGGHQHLEMDLEANSATLAAHDTTVSHSAPVHLIRPTRSSSKRPSADLSLKTVKRVLSKCNVGREIKRMGNWKGEKKGRGEKMCY